MTVTFKLQLNCACQNEAQTFKLTVVLQTQSMHNTHGWYSTSCVNKQTKKKNQPAIDKSRN